VAIVLRNGQFERATVATRIADLLRDLSEMAVVGIDMPIGLTGGDERRQADHEARAFVGARGSSVFPTYPREVYEADGYDGARETCLTLTGHSISRQAYGLRERLLELDYVSVGRDRVREVHPEVSFCEMAGQPLTWSKTSWNGLHERLRLLRDHNLIVPSEITDVGNAGAEDILDAAAAAWSANRIATGRGQSLPDPPQIAGGREIAIWR
jgi:predicted RNase H-like nuclease